MKLAVYVTAYRDRTFLQLLSVGSINDYIRRLYAPLAARLIHFVQPPLPITQRQLIKRCFL